MQSGLAVKKLLSEVGSEGGKVTITRLTVKLHNCLTKEFL